MTAAGITLFRINASFSGKNRKSKGKEEGKRRSWNLVVRDKEREKLFW